MKNETKKHIKEAIQTLLIAICCFVCASSINQSCSNTMNKLTTKKKVETNKAQIIKNNINFVQKVR